ncbi:MAG: LysR family transcriptional regulator [Rubrobacteridae bacterium]|nr:LysR family transcriptional regulator [Rubrobacteridae bacterium]
MNLNQLKAFTSIVEKETFSAAARAMGVSQPAVSLQIQSLEEQIGVTLLDRRTKKVKLTEAGKLFYGTAVKILAQLDEFDHQLGDLGDTVKGNLAIGGSTIPGEYILPRILGKFKKDYPEVSIALRISDTDEIIEKLITGELHVGMVGAKPVSSQLDSQPFLYDELVLITPSGYSLSRSLSNDSIIKVANLIDSEFILRERGSGTRQSIERYFSKIGLSVNSLKISMELGSTEAVVNAVSAGLGVSIVSIWAIEKHLKIGELEVMKLPESPVTRAFYLVESKQSSSRCIQAFTNYIKNLDTSEITPQKKS